MALKIGGVSRYGFFEPYSEKSIRRFAGKGRFYEYLLRFALEDVIYIYDDFLNEALDQTNGKWITNVTGTGAAAAAVPDTANGILRITGGTDDNGGGRAASQLAFKGDLNCGMLTSVKANAITAVKIEAGFTDAQTETSSVGSVNALATPTSTASDYACLIVDTDDTNAMHGITWHFASDGSTTNMNATATVSASPAISAVAATYDKLLVNVIGDLSWGYVNGRCIAAHGNTTASQLEGGTAMCAYLHAQTRVVTTNVLVDFDYIAIWQDRA